MPTFSCILRVCGTLIETLVKPSVLTTPKWFSPMGPIGKLPMPTEKFKIGERMEPFTAIPVGKVWQLEH